MADKSKLEKIAAAKKRLKQFQNKQSDGDARSSEQPATAAAAAAAAAQEKNTADIMHEISTAATTTIEESDEPPQQYATNEENHSFPPSLAISGSTEPLNQQLKSELDAERERNTELELQLRSQATRIVSLQNEIDKLQTTAPAAAVTMSLGPLQEQLAAHVQTIGVLVGEKAELAAALNKFQGLAKDKCGEVEELQGRLNASRHRVQALEKEMAEIRSSGERFNGAQERLCTELEQSLDTQRRLQKRVDDAIEEIAELNQSVLLKNKDIDRLETELTVARSDISMSNLRVQQLSAGDISSSLDADRTATDVAEQRHHFEQQTVELQQIVQQLRTEQDQISAHYQGYVQQLTTENTGLSKQLQLVADDCDRLAKREQSLVKHVSELERQIQQQFTKQKSIKAADSSMDNVPFGSRVADTKLMQVQELNSVLRLETIQLRRQLNEDVQRLQSQLQHKEQTINDLQSTVERLQAAQQSPTDAQSLIASIESDKVAASRAVAQNVELKQQLDEIQLAFIQISNDKLELTDRLASEQHLGRENRLKAGTLDAEVDKIKETLHYKDEEMIRLTHENEELHKQILQNSQEVDRLRHYEAKATANASLQQQLQQANETQRTLRQRIKKLEQQNVVVAVEQNDDTIGGVDDVVASTTSADEDVVDDDNANPHVDMVESDAVDIGSTQTLASEEAMEKLQQRFTKTMHEIADLTEEKNRLEHLVMQLQGETETIGEYIALYQNQRRLLKQRENEKDVQLQQIVRDREEMRDKLLQLNGLVEQLLRQKGESTDDALKPLMHTRDSIDNAEHQSQPLINGNDDGGGGGGNGADVAPVHGSASSDVVVGTTKHAKGNTAEKILNLLSEIQDKNKNYAEPVVPSGECHNCAYCYGQLKNV